MSNLTITYLGTNALLSHYPLLDYFQAPKLSSQGSNSVIPALSRNPGSGSQVSARDDGGGGKFTLVVFSIPEEKRQIRDRLRYVLKSAGFGQINRSLYISPHLTIKEARHLSFQGLDPLGSNPIKPRTIVFSVPYESFKEIDKEMLKSFWNLKEVEELYDEALSSVTARGSLSLRAQRGDLDEIVPRSGHAGRAPLCVRISLRDDFGLTPRNDDGLSFAAAGRFLSKFLDAFGQDPFLPPRLLPNNWPGRRALEIAKEILTW